MLNGCNFNSSINDSNLTQMAVIILFSIQRCMENVVRLIAKVFGSMLKAHRVNLVFNLKRIEKMSNTLIKKQKKFELNKIKLKFLAYEIDKLVLSN